MSRVFVVQRQQRKDETTGELVSKFDVTPAEEYGDIIDILSPSAAPFHPPAVLGQMHQVLKSFCDDDYLLLTGNPVLIGLAAAIAADYNGGAVNFLQWSGKEKRYLVIRAEDIFSDLLTAPGRVT